jgi:hypothetical protein
VLRENSLASRLVGEDVSCASSSFQRNPRQHLTRPRRGQGRADLDAIGMDDFHARCPVRSSGYSLNKLSRLCAASARSESTKTTLALSPLLPTKPRAI